MSELNRRNSDGSQNNHLVLQLDWLRILVPQKHIRVLELSTDMDTQGAPMGAVGMIPVAGESLAVYHLPPELDRLAGGTAVRKICAVMVATDGEHYGLLCDEVALLDDPFLELREVPAALRQLDSPVEGLILHGGELLCVSSADSVLRLIQTLKDRSPALYRSEAVRSWRR
ncbi:MAG TPA: hypothetical protein VGT99_13290 [Gammaproteobacteria bacterium]|nr:hypothetical protein [Gammaproteobacteria bacterium]